VRAPQRILRPKRIIRRIRSAIFVVRGDEYHQSINSLLY
jgi:hypothetical protein